MHISFCSCLIFTFYHSFWVFFITVFSDNYDDDYDSESYINDNNENNECNHHNDYNDDDNDNNFDNDNGDQAVVIFQAIHLGELFACKKSEFCECTDPNVAS